jgi:hypothetical protein
LSIIGSSNVFDLQFLNQNVRDLFAENLYVFLVYILLKHDFDLLNTSTKKNKKKIKIVDDDFNNVVINNDNINNNNYNNNNILTNQQGIRNFSL